MAKISIADRNQRYWAYDGEPTLLLGGSVEDNLFQIEGLRSHLDTLVEVGGNYVRCTMSSRDEGNEWPYTPTEGGYDLNRFNDEYWECFDRLLSETAERNIVVQVEIWDGWDFRGEPWADNPFNPDNNVTYDRAESKLPSRIRSQPRKVENPFFWTPPDLDDNQSLRRYQEAFVDKLLEHALGYDHVLFCVDNETDADPGWGRFWSRYIANRADGAGVTTLTTEMWNPWELRHPKHFNTIDDTETYDFVEVSQNNFQRDEEHYDALLATRHHVDPPRPMNNVKTYGSDTSAGGFGSERDGIERFWRNVFAGCASSRFHRPPSGLGLQKRARDTIRAVRTVTDAVDLFAMEPRNDLLVGRNHRVNSGAYPNTENQVYLLANPGEEYMVYFLEGGTATIRLDTSALACEWFDVGEVKWGEEASLDAGTLQTPGDGQWVAVVR